MAITHGWLTVARSEEILEGTPIAIEVKGEEVALFRIDGQLYATDNLCTHSFARLCEGFIDGYEIECPLHQGRFDVRTGQASREPCEEPIRTYRVRESDGLVQIAEGHTLKD
jgi:naphthalene 1,2-dioxygenase system ferredoxin subunit